MNYCLGVPTATVWEHPFILGESMLSDHDYGFHHLLLHEFFHKTLSIQAGDLAQAPPSGFGLSDNLFGAGAALREQSWSGPWNDRKWNNYLAFTRITHEEAQEAPPTVNSKKE